MTANTDSAINITAPRPGFQEFNCFLEENRSVECCPGAVQERSSVVSIICQA